MDTVLMASIALCMLAMGALKLAGDPVRRRARQVLAGARWLEPASADGQVVKVTGVVRAVVGDGAMSAAYKSPLSDTECVAFRIQARIRSTRGVTNALHDVMRARRFVLDRGAAGRVIVDCNHALLAHHPTVLAPGELADRIHRLWDLGFDQANAARSELEETVIGVGSTVTVAGTLELTLDNAPRGERGYRDPGTLGVRLVGDREHPIVIGPA